MISKENCTLGLGGVTFGREIDKATSFELMDFAYDHNIIDFDTAAIYGNGLSEEIIGSWLTNHPAKRNKVKVCTKVFLSFGYDQIKIEVEKSLLRLKIDAIDLLYFHRWDDALNTIESWAAVDELLKQGKIRGIGASNFNAEQLANAMLLLKQNNLNLITAVQNNNNLAVSDLSEEMLNLCKLDNINIITFSPLGAGFLTGKHKNGVAAGSRFDLMPAHQQMYFNNFAQHRLTKLLSVSKETGYAPEFLAMAWATHQQNINQVLIGGRNVEQLAFAIDAAEFHNAEIFASLVR